MTEPSPYVFLRVVATGAEYRLYCATRKLAEKLKNDIIDELYRVCRGR